MKTLNTTCYTIQDGKIVKGTLADFTRFIKCTTRPTGVGYTYYATTTEAGVWALARWDSWSDSQVIVREFPSEKLANTVVEAIYVYDICHNREFEIYFRREHAKSDPNQTQES